MCCAGRERELVRGSVAGSGGGRGCREPRRIGGRINPVAGPGLTLRTVALQAASQTIAGHAQVSESFFSAEKIFYNNNEARTNALC